MGLEKALKKGDWERRQTHNLEKALLVEVWSIYSKKGRASTRGRRVSCRITKPEYIQKILG